MTFIFLGGITDMNMNVKKARIGQKIYDIIDLDVYNLIDTNIYGPCAVEFNNHIYPERARGDKSPGIYKEDWGSYLIHPQDDDGTYSSDNIINFSDTENIKELIEKSNKLKDLERDILTSPDNIFIPKISSRDEPVMRGLKEAVIAKNIDIYKYAPRFGANFQNDRRLFNNTSITLSKMTSFLNNLDMKGTLIIEDAAPNVPNPIGYKIVIDLNNPGSDTDE